MRSHTTTALYVVLMAAVIVAIDVLFFKNRFWERLTVNVGIVLVSQHSTQIPERPMSFGVMARRRGESRRTTRIAAGP